MIMKQLFFFLASATLALSQSASLPPVTSMTPESLDRIINETVMKNGGPDLRRKLLADALTFKRIDLIKVFFVSPYTEGDTYRAIAALPDNEMRQKTAVMMLRIPTATCWPNEELFRNMSGVRATGMHEPFISTVSSLLPGEVLTKEMVATKAARQQLADRLLAALIAQGTVISVEEKAILEAPPEAASKPAAVEVPFPTGQPAAAQVSSPAAPLATPSPEIAPSPKAATLPRHWLWLTGGILAVIFLGWQALKKRR